MYIRAETGRRTDISFMAVVRGLLLLLIALIAGVVASCASASGKRSQASCALAPGDSVYLARGPVYRECAVEKRAKLIDGSAHPDFQPSTPPAGGQECYRADVEFVVDATGTPETETAKVLKTNHPSYAESVLRAVGRWHYAPALLNGVPVRQIVQTKAGMGVVTVVVPAGGIARPPARPPQC